MSGELKPKVEWVVGQPVVLRKSWGRDQETLTGVITHVARKYGRVKADRDIYGNEYQFLLETGRAVNNGFYHVDTPEIWAYNQRVKDAWATLQANGLESAGYGHSKLHDRQLFAVAELLEREE